MKISYAQVFQSAPFLNVMSSKPFSAGLAIKLVDIIDQLNPHLTAIEQFRDQLSSQSDTLNSEELNTKFAEYLNGTTAEVTFTPIHPEEADAAGLAFTVREMASVRFMFSTPLNSRRS